MVEKAPYHTYKTQDFIYGVAKQA